MHSLLFESWIKKYKMENKKNKEGEMGNFYFQDKVFSYDSVLKVFSPSLK